jgi:hypothetical protein
MAHPAPSFPTYCNQFSHDDGGSKHLPNTCNKLPIKTASYPWKLYSIVCIVWQKLNQKEGYTLISWHLLHTKNTNAGVGVNLLMWIWESMTGKWPYLAPTKHILQTEIWGHYSTVFCDYCLQFRQHGYFQTICHSNLSDFSSHWVRF